MRNTRYEMLIRILDEIREDSRGTKWQHAYSPGSNEEEEINQGRSRAFIHLYLKVTFGITNFLERESFVTDGTQDGGIDGYYIDEATKQIHLIQSKFRTNVRNFEEKQIDPREILAMDIDRITRGSDENDRGEKYNGKILGLIRRISEISDIARYSYRVILLANCNLDRSAILRLTDGHPAVVFDFSKTYKDLVFSSVAGVFFRSEELTIALDLNHKSAGAKTSYTVQTPHFECEITVLFLPAIEVAKFMDKYRNSILKFNPRSYLELEGGNVIRSIRETVLRPDSNEFALMNNGLTIISDETDINERVGQRNKAQVRLLRPQLINGGQTAFTLSRIYAEDRAGAEKTFLGKEVLCKVITLTPKDETKNLVQERQELIDKISEASNRQTPVNSADRLSNDTTQLAIQSELFDRFGILYERKRGEFSDGVRAGYVSKEDILERNLFFRLWYAAKGRINDAKQKRIFVNQNLSAKEILNPTDLERFIDAYTIFGVLRPHSTDNVKRYRDVIAKVYLGVSLTSRTDSLGKRLSEIEEHWLDFLSKFSRLRASSDDKLLSDFEKSKKIANWMRSNRFEADVLSFVSATVNHRAIATS